MRNKNRNRNNNVATAETVETVEQPLDTIETVETVETVETDEQPVETDETGEQPVESGETDEQPVEQSNDNSGDVVFDAAALLASLTAEQLAQLRAVVAPQPQATPQRGLSKKLQVLEFITAMPATNADIAAYMSISETAAASLIGDLKRDKHVILSSKPAGSKYTYYASQAYYDNEAAAAAADEAAAAAS